MVLLLINQAGSLEIKRNHVCFYESLNLDEDLLIPMRVTGAVHFSSGLVGDFLCTRPTAAGDVPLLHARPFPLDLSPHDLHCQPSGDDYDR